MKRAPAVLMISVVITLIGSNLSVGAAPATPARMASSAGDTFVPQAINRTPTGGPPVGLHPQTQQRTEVVGKRTRTSDTYSLGQLYEAVVYPGSINYQDAAGKWQPIDNTLVQSSRTGYALTNKANRYAADLPSDLSQAPVRFALGSSWVEFSLVGATGKGAVSSDTDTFLNALPNVSVAFSARNDALKEALSLQSLAAGNSFSYRVQTSPDLSAKAQPAGGISFIDGSGRTQFSFAPPTMFDAAGGQTNIPHAVTMNLSQGPSGLTVSLVADSTWLSDPARKWPVTIDPTISLTGSDCWLTSGLPNSSYCGSTDIRVGTDGFAYARALVKIQPETVLGRVEVRSASLQLYDFFNSTSNTTPVGLYQVTQSSDNTATWNNATTAQPWTTAGGTIATPAAVTNNTVGGTTGWQYWYPTQLVQSWINGTVPDYGMLLKEPTENVVNVIEFDSATSGNSTLWPHLNVTYDPGLGEQKSFQYDSNVLTDHMDLKVNVGNGNLVLHNHDLSIRGTGLDLGIDRYFNNLADTTWDFGSRWTLNLGWDVFLLPQADGTVRYAAPTGFQTVFTPNGSAYTPPPDFDANLVKNGDGTFTLSFNQTGERYQFTSGGTFTADVDKNGNTITYAYDASSRLSSITDTQGRVTTFSYTSPININFVSLITDPAGRKYQYAYDANVNLTSYTDPAQQVTQFAYDAGHNLTQITDPLGNVTKISFSAGQVTSLTRVSNPSAGTGPTTTLTYNAGNTVVTDANGNKTTYYIDSSYRVTQIVDPLNNANKSTYNANGQASTATDPLGQTTTNTYNSNNDLTTATLPALGSGHTPATSTETFNTPTSVAGYQYLQSSKSDPQGSCEADFYDAAGNLTDAYAGQVSPCDGMTGGSHISHRYQGDAGINCGAKPGELCSTTDADGNATTYGYDSNGNRVSITPPSPLGATTVVRDGLSRIASTTDGKGQKTTYSYDALDRTTQILYGGAISCTPSTGNCISYTFDADGNVSSMNDNTGITQYYYDRINRLTTQALPDSSSNCAGSSPAGITFSYDAMGNLTQYCDSGGGVTYAYDAGGRVVSMAEPGGNCGSTPSWCTTFSYNADGQRTQITFPGAATLSSRYDSDWNVTSVIGKDKNGTVLTSFSYTYSDGNADMQVRHSMTETDPVANNTVTYSYNGLDRLTQATVSSGVGTSYSYVYDANANMLSKTAGSSTTSYAYGPGNEICWAYSGTSSAACSAPPTGATTYSFDANGNELGNSSGASFAYNAKDQTAAITYAGNTLSPLTYSGTAQGNRTGAGSTAFASGPLGIQIATTGGNSTYILRDSLGKLIGERVAGSHYYYLTDGLGSIVAVVTGDGLGVGDRYGYDPYGNTTYHSGSVANPWGYAGGYTDSTGLVKFGARYYDPAIARWTQLDALTVPNRYVYAGCDPINSSDPSGLASVKGPCGISTLIYNRWSGRFTISLRSFWGPLTEVHWGVGLNGWLFWLAYADGIALVRWKTFWWTWGYIPFHEWDNNATWAAFTGWVWISPWWWTRWWIICTIGPVFVRF